MNEMQREINRTNDELEISKTHKEFIEQISNMYKFASQEEQKTEE